MTLRRRQRFLLQTARLAYSIYEGPGSLHHYLQDAIIGLHKAEKLLPRPSLRPPEIKDTDTVLPDSGYLSQLFVVRPVLTNNRPASLSNDGKPHIVSCICREMLLVKFNPDGDLQSSQDLGDPFPNTPVKK